MERDSRSWEGELDGVCRSDEDTWASEEEEGVMLNECLVIEGQSVC